MSRLLAPSSPEWTTVVLRDFDAFLADHACCERKANASALMFVSHYRDRKTLVREMIELAREELEHFQQVYRLMEERGIILPPDPKDPYVAALAKAVRDPSEAHFLDRLIMAGVIEARACERLKLVAEALPHGPLKEFYMDLAKAEARHHGLFVRLAKEYFPEDKVEARLDFFLDLEAKVVESLPLRPAIH